MELVMNMNAINLNLIVLKEAQYRKEREASEVEKLQVTVQRLEEEKKLLMDEITQLKEILKREVDGADQEKRNNAQVVNDYKLVRQRLDMQLSVARQELETLMIKMSSCPDCSSFLEENSQAKKNAGLGDQASNEERIRELELELAQTKLAHVEAECRNQNLTHQLRATEQELAKHSWAPWMSKAINSFKE